MGALEDVVAPAAPDARDDSLVAQVGGQVALRVAGADELGELLGAGLGAEPGQRAVVARGEHPPRRLALRAVLADEDADARAVEPGVARAEDEARHGAAGLGLLGGLLDIEAPGLGEVQDDPVAVVEVPDEVFGAAGDVLEAMVLRSSGAGAYVLSDEKPRRSALRRVAPARSVSRRSDRACISGNSGTPQCTDDLYARAPRIRPAQPHLAHGRELRRRTCCPLCGPACRCSTSAAGRGRSPRTSHCSSAPGEVVGIDASSEVVAQAAAAVGPGSGSGLSNLRFEVGDLFALEYPDASFDVIHLHQVLQHLSRPGGRRWWRCGACWPSGACWRRGTRTTRRSHGRRRTRCWTGGWSSIWR